MGIDGRPSVTGTSGAMTGCGLSGEEATLPVLGPVGFSGGQPDSARTAGIHRQHAAHGHGSPTARGDGVGDPGSVGRDRQQETGGLTGTVGGEVADGGSATSPTATTSMPTAETVTAQAAAAQPPTAYGTTSSGAPGSSDADSDSEMMARFLREYLDLLDGRLDAIRASIRSGEVDDARVALLSLESTSGMIGERELVRHLHELRHALETASAPQQEALIAVIESEAAGVRGRRAAA